MKQGMGDNGNEALQVRDITYRFAGEPAPIVENLSFDVRAGEFVTFLAPSGIGKTTLFRLIAGLLEPEAGAIRVGAGGGPRLGRVGYMPQRDCLMPWRSVLDNAALGLELAGTARAEARRRVLELLPSFGLDGTEKKYPHELSGGMRQRVSFLRSMLGGNEMLLLDEPFSALDAMTRVGMQEWLLGIWERYRKTVLFITHDVDEALLLSDRVLVAVAAPIRSLAEVDVGLPRPREYGMTMEPAFIERKKQVLELLRLRGQTAAPVVQGGAGA